MFRPVVGFALGLSTVVWAQTPLVTDRPDFTESAVVVPRGRTQIEMGLSATRAGAETDGEVSGPEALVRAGVVRGVEVRVGLPDYVGVGRDDGGFGDPSLGVKIEVGRLGAWDVATILETSVPLGERPFGDAPASPLGLLVLGRDLGALSLGTQGEVLWDRASDRVEAGATAVVGVPLTEAASAFFEVAAGSTPDGADARVHVGGTLLLSATVQLDARLGAGLTEAAPGVFGGVGVGVRL